MAATTRREEKTAGRLRHHIKPTGPMDRPVSAPFRVGTVSSIEPFFVRPTGVESRSTGRFVCLVALTRGPPVDQGFELKFGQYGHAQLVGLFEFASRIFSGD